MLMEFLTTKYLMINFHMRFLKNRQLPCKPTSQELKSTVNISFIASYDKFNFKTFEHKITVSVHTIL